MLPATQDDLLVLSDGTILERHQTEAIRLRVSSNLSLEQIAKRSGYDSKQGVHGLLNSPKGREGMRIAAQQYLTHAGVDALAGLITLSQSSKSDKVKFDALSKLVDMAGIGQQPGETQPSRPAAGLSISINLGNGESSPPTLDITPSNG
ncbi:hypothetical protein [Rhodobacter lacus]|uniref:Uncharacterized protein n=1 Tax=Rhodobacter lacus TaxID=1641972 RepID=A0ABW5ADI3_9RHOB